MKLKILKEHYVNLWSTEADQEMKLKYADEVMDILEKTYKDIGGPHTDKEEIIQDNIYWKLVRRGDHLSAASLYKIQGNHRKLIAGGSDQTPQGKADMKEILRDDIYLVDRGAYGEVSEGAERFLLGKLGVKPIPAEIAAKVLANQPRPKKVLEIEEDGYHYKRKIGDEILTKVMVGNIPEEFLS